MSTAKRLVALDVLRGLTIALMILVNTPGSWSYVYKPLRHAPWNGCTPTDLVFPFFLFIVGVSMWYSFKKYGDEITKSGLQKVLKRFLVIFLLGLFLNAFPKFEFENLRYFGVLQRIAIAYAIAAILCMKFDFKGLIISFIVLLLGYWIVIHFLGTENPYSLETNIVRKIDLLLFGEQHLYGGYGVKFDPEGLLSSIPAVGSVLLGYFSGRIIDKSGGVFLRIRNLMIYGVIAVVIGLVWHNGFPINKPIWSSSYVLFTGGLGMLFLAMFLWLIDIMQLKWAFKPFLHFGMNPLFIFVLAGMFGRVLRYIKVTNGLDEKTTILNFYYTDILTPLFGHLNGSLAYAVSHVVFFWMIAYILFKSKVFIKI